MASILVAGANNEVAGAREISRRSVPDSAGVRAIKALHALASDPDEWPRLVEALRAPSSQAPGAPFVLHDAAPAAAGPAGPRAALVVIGPSGGVSAASDNAGSDWLRALGLAPRSAEVDEALSRARDTLRRDSLRPVIVSLTTDAGELTFGYGLPAHKLAPSLAGRLKAGPHAPGSIALIFPDPTAPAAFWSTVETSFGLTGAEARLAAMLTDGLTLKDAARALNVSQNTVRNQLAAIFGKTGLQRQADLVRTLTDLAALSPELAPVGGPAPHAARLAPDVEHLRLEDGRAVAFREYGARNGRPVMVFHAGLGASLLPPDTHRIARSLGLRLVVPDRPGVGRSDPLRPYSLRQSAQDMAALSQALALGPLQFCSFTSGARYALATAVAMRPDATRILLLSPRPPQDGAVEASAARSPMALFQSRIGGHLWLLDPLFSTLRKRLTPNMMGRIMQSSALGAGDAEYLQAHPELRELFVEAMNETLARTSRGAADEIRSARMEPWPDPADVAAPIIVWHGEEDAYASPAGLRQWLGGAMAELRIFPAIGNYLIHAHWQDALRWLAGAN